VIAVPAAYRPPWSWDEDTWANSPGRDMGWCGATAADDHCNPEIFTKLLSLHSSISRGVNVWQRRHYFRGKHGIGNALTTKDCCALK